MENFIRQKVQTGNKRYALLSLQFLHSDPSRNVEGCKTTPLHVALDQNSQLAFDIMLGLLSQQTKVCVTPHLLDRLPDIMNKNSDVVLDFFNDCFFITDQFREDQVLEWADKDQDELFVHVPSSYLTKEYLQKIVNKKLGNPKDKLEDETIQIENDDKFTKMFGSHIQVESKGIITYSDEIEDFTE